MNLSDADKRKLRDAFSVKASLNGNLMNLIGLDEIRSRFPEMWERHQARIVESCRAILKQFTDPDCDIVLPVGEGNFLVLFSRLSKDEAMLRAGVIKAEILRRFIGDDALAALDVEIHTLDIDAGSISSGSLRDLLGSAMRAEPPRRDAGPVRRAAEAPGGKSQQRRMYRASITELGAGASLSVDALEAQFDFSLDSLEFAFQPLLYVKRNVFSVFECWAARYGLAGEILTGYGVLPRDVGAEQVAALDQMTLMRARHGLVDMAVRKRVAVVAAPVSFETMSNRAMASDYLALLQKIPSDLRNYLVVDLCRCPEGVPEGRLAEVINPLRRFTRAVFVRVTSPKQQLGPIKAAGAFGVGLGLPGKGGTADMGTAAFLERFAGMARKLGLQVYADEVDTQDKAALCRAAGFDYIAGRALAELSDYVGPVTEPRAA